MKSNKKSPKPYQYRNGHLKFKPGSFSEKIAYDRYATPDHNPDNMKIGDIVVVKLDRNKDARKVGVIDKFGELGRTAIITTREIDFEGNLQTETGEFHLDQVTKVLDLNPTDFWDRWAKAGSSVEKSDEQFRYEQLFKEYLFDGYAYSLGGRIQLSAGQEFVTGEKADLTAYNCFHGDTIVQTMGGAKRIKDISGDVYVQSMGGVFRRANFKSFGYQELFEVTLENGETIKTTAGHEWIVSKRGGGTERVTTVDLEDRQIPVIPNKVRPMITHEIEQGIKHGIFYGDGTINNSHGKLVGQIMLFGEKREFAKYFSGHTQTPHHEDKYLGIYGIDPLLKNLPDESATESYWYGFIVGLIATDGFCDSRGSCGFHNSDPEALKVIVRNLYKTGFMYSSVKMTREVNPYNGAVSPCYKVQLMKHTVSHTDLIKRSHWEKFINSPKQKYGAYMRVVSVKPLHEVTEVFCCEEPETHSFVIGTGYLTGNCYVGASPDVIPTLNYEGSLVSEEAYKAIVDNLIKQAEIMARGGGYGINFGTVPGAIKTPGISKWDVILYLDKSHPDYVLLKDDILLGKFQNVTLVDEYRDIPGDFEVVTVGDSREGILKGLHTLIDRAFDGSKIAFNFNGLRSKGAYVAGVNGRSSGAPSWMQMFDVLAYTLGRGSEENPGVTDAVELMELPSEETGLIEQGGSRRGALMLMLPDNHPNVRKFIHRKKTKGKLQFANVSVAISNAFMKRLKEGDAETKQLWMEIIESAWKSAEPGVVFMEFYNEESNSWYFAPIICTNPCGEQGLPAWAVCNLGHLRLPAFMNKDKTDMDWKRLKKAVHLGVRYQDNIIDYTKYYLPENEEQQKSERRVGMGTMGLATLLINLKIRYGSPESIAFIDKLYRFIAVEAYKASIDLAEEKGAFPMCDPNLMAKSGFMKRMLPELDKENADPEMQETYAQKFMRVGTRNVTLLTQAPTGSTATYKDVLLQEYDPTDGASTGIEPYFALEFYRTSRAGKTKQYVAIAKAWADAHPGEELPDYFVTAQDLSPEDHVKVQAAVQKWTDSSISKTANCPSDFTVEDTAKLYELAFDLGCKGVTIYRDGSRDAQVLSTKEDGAKLESEIEAEKLAELKGVGALKVEIDMDKVAESVIAQIESKIKTRPSRVFGFTEKVRYTSGDAIAEAYVTVNVDDNRVPLEVFITATEPRDMPICDALGRTIAIYLQDSSIDHRVDKIVKHLKKGQTMMSLPAVVGRLIEQTYYGKIEFPGTKKEPAMTAIANPDAPTGHKCPDCGSNNFDKVNCICRDCGASHCN